MSCISSMCLFCVIFLEFEVILMASYTLLGIPCWFSIWIILSSYIAFLPCYWGVFIAYLISLNLNIGLFFKQLLSDITVNIWWMSFRALSYTLINLLHGYPYFVLKFLFWQKSCQERVQSGCLGERERMTRCLMSVCECVWLWDPVLVSGSDCVPLFVFVTDCLCVPILVYGSDCVFQSWFMGLTVCSSFGQCVWPCAPIFVYIYDCLCVPVLVCLSDRVFLILCLWSSFCPCVRLWDWRVSVSGDMGLCSSLCHLCCLIDIQLMLKWYLNEMLNLYMTYV